MINFNRFDDECYGTCPDLKYSCSPNGSCIEDGSGIYNSLSDCIQAIKFGECVASISPTPTRTNTPTPTPTKTETPTPTPTTTETPTPTPTTTETPTPTPTLTQTPTLTVTNTQTPTPSITATITPTPTITETVTPTPTVTETVTPTPTVTPTTTPCPEVIICSGFIDDYLINCGLLIELQIEKNEQCCCQLEYSVNGSGVWLPVPTSLVYCNPTLTYTLNPTCFGDIIP